MIKRRLSQIYKRRLMQISICVICAFYLCNLCFSENKVITDVKKWEYIETEHFKIYHYPECKELLPVISEILEETFNNTTRFYEYRPSKKIPFFIYRNHNEFEQTNIVDVGEGTGGVTEAFKNRFIVYNDGSVRWLRNVIPHEFTHVMQFTVLYEESPLLKALRLSRGIFIPLWMMEGMAEYNTGETDATTRGMVIRDMVSNKNVISLKNLSTFNHLKPHQITPAYKLSETAYHFLVDEYGPDKPQRILKVLRDKLDTTSAFIDILNITPGLFIEKWEEWLTETYEDKIAGFKEAKDYGVKVTSDNGDNIPDSNTNPAISPDGKSIAYITDDDGTNKIVVMEFDTKKKKNVALGNSSEIDVIHNEKISFSPDGNILAFSGEKTQKDYIFIYDIENEKLNKLPLDIFTVKSPSFSPAGKKIIFVGMERAYNDIYEFNFEDNSVKKITDDPENQLSPSYSPDGNFIAFSQEDTDTYQSDIFLFDSATGEKIRLTDFPGNETEPVFSADGEWIFFTSDENPGSPVNIYTVSVDGKKIEKCTNLLTGAFNLCTNPDGKSLLFVNYRNFRKDVYIADISKFNCEGAEVNAVDPAVAISTGTGYLSSPIFPYRFKPSLDILVPFVMYHSEYGLFLATYWQASELLGDHQIYNQILYSSADGELQYTVGYSYLKWRPQFLFSSVGENTEYLTTSEETYREKEHTQSLAVIYPLDRYNSLSASVSTKKYTEENTTADETIADQRTNRYSVAFDRNTVTGKYLYARFGSNLRLLFRNALTLYDGDIEYKEYIIRYEKYFPAFSESAAILGGLFASSEGSDKRFFRLPLRGFSQSDGYYNRIIATTIEYRFPILTLENIWPISDFFLKSINTFFFTDNSFGFNNTQDYQNITIDEIKNSVGSGVRFYTFLAGYLLPITVEYAKRTNDFGDRWSFSLGVSLAY